MKNLIIILGLFNIWMQLSGQTDTIQYIYSDFETLADQQRWVSMPDDNIIKWSYQRGGNDGYNPDFAFSGELNAFFHWADPSYSYTRDLISPVIDLSDAKKPQLSFAHASIYDHPWGTHKLTVLIRANNTDPWLQIAEYSLENDWKVDKYNIADYGAKYLSPNFQVAFRGSSESGGHGVCVDSVVIEEKDIIIRYLKSVKAKHVAQNPIPSGIKDIPIMRVDLTVVGNTDQAILNSLRFVSLSDQDSLFANQGFEIVATKDSIYRPTQGATSLKIGTSVSISGQTVTFTGLNYNLTTGYNAIWLLADVKATAPYGSKVDFKIPVNGISVNSSNYPATEISPVGMNTIEQAVFLDEFEGAASAWTYSTDFEIDVPEGLSAQTTTDPSFAYGGTKILGTDITVDGKYRLNINDLNAYYAETPSINLQYYTNVKLNLKKWFAFEGNDEGVIEVSNNNGVTWQRIWDSKINALIPDNDWVNLSILNEFNAIAAHQSNVKIRFGIVKSDASNAYAGFNIDNFSVTGKYLTNDVGILEINRPYDDCHNPGMDSVEVVIHNYADGPTINSIPVFFSIDGSVGKRVTEYIPGPIPRDGTITYVFAHAANFPSPGSYNNFTAAVQVPGDEDPANNQVTTPVYIQRSVNPPDLERFETGGGYWKRYGTDPRWLCKIPEGSIPLLSGSSWISSPYGNYLTSDTAFLESSCYDLVSEDRMIFEMSLWLDSEAGKDGGSLEYSPDEGNSWFPVTAHEFPWTWNWYNGFVSALGSEGWSGNYSQNWRNVKQVLPAALNGEPKVKFRIKWASDEENTYRGMAIDNVKIYPAPYDIGVTGIDSFANRCQNLNPDEVTVTITNLGINSLKQNDTVIVGFDFNQSRMEVDTFRLSSALLPGESMKHTFDRRVNAKAPGNYNLMAYTLIEDNPWFYEENNDTVSLNFMVYPAPLTTLPDTIQTHTPDTVVLRTYYNATYDYWWNGVNGSDSYNVNDDGWQYLKVTATRGNGCSAYDSTNVELLFYDIGAASLQHPTDNCGFSKHEFPVIRIRNYGTDSISAGQKITVVYQMNAGIPVSDTLKLTSALHSGKTTDFTFTKGSVDLSEQGIYNFTVYTSYGGDTITGNDTAIKSIEILGRPAVTLGPDITVEALSHTLNAGNGYSSYLWDNAETMQSRVVTESGSYWVKVTDNNGCDNADTVSVRLKIRDVSPGTFVSPLSDCRFTSGEPVTMRVYNSGTDTISSGSTIGVSYRFEEGGRVNGLITLSSQLIPGAFVTHTFPGTVDLLSEADYHMEATAVITGDLRTNNDTARQLIYRYPQPVIDFGLENTEFIEDIMLQIDAGYSPWYAYQWQDTVTSHVYVARSSGLYHVKATDTRTQCFDRDSVMVYLIYGDVGVTASDMPLSGCSGTYADVELRIQNLGPSSIGSSAPIYVACDVNGERITIDTLNRAGNFNPGASIYLTLSGIIPVNEAGLNRIAFYTLYNEDKITENDTFSFEFEALSSPVIDFGDNNGWLTVDLPHELDAGPGYQSYLWQDNSSMQSFMVTENGIYSVTVTAQNDCQTTKTVRINMVNSINNRESAREISIYPNPGNGLFHVSINDAGTGDAYIRVFNNQGQMVYLQETHIDQLKNEQVDIRHLSRGIYHLVIQTEENHYQGKIVIE